MIFSPIRSKQAKPKQAPPKKQTNKKKTTKHTKNTTTKKTFSVKNKHTQTLLWSKEKGLVVGKKDEHFIYLEWKEAKAN